MPVRSHRRYRAYLLGGSAMLALLGLGGAALAQVALPEIAVTSSREKPKPRPATRPATSAPVVAPLTPAEQAMAKNNAFDQSRSNLYTTIGTTSSTQTHATIDALPQGTNTTVEKVLLQAPGVSQDSAASGSLHVRNDHANLQFRINGVMLPDGVTGFGSILDTGLIGTIALVTGALPAEFGLRTVGLIDITTRADVFNNSGSISLYGGGRGTITPSFEYGGTFGGNCPTTSSSTVTKAPPSSVERKLLSRRAILLHRPLSANHRRHRKYAADAQCHPRFLAAGAGFWLHVDLHRPDDPAEPDHGNVLQHIPDSQHARPSRRNERQSAGHQRVRRHHF